MRPFLISYDLPVAPAEDAFKEAVRSFNIAFSSLYQVASVETSTEVFLVLREDRGKSSKGVQINYDSSRRFLGIDCPLRVHFLEDGASSVMQSLALTMIRALRAAQSHCKTRDVVVDFEGIIEAIKNIVRVEHENADALYLPSDRPEK